MRETKPMTQRHGFTLNCQKETTFLDCLQWLIQPNPYSSHISNKYCCSTAFSWRVQLWSMPSFQQAPSWKALSHAGAPPQVQMFLCRDGRFGCLDSRCVGLFPTERGTGNRESCWSGRDQIQTNHTCIHTVYTHINTYASFIIFYWCSSIKTQDV